jgi:YfiH family protein
MEWRERHGVRWLEADLSGARAPGRRGPRAAFSARVGGVSDEPFSTLNLALLTGDRRGDVRENRRRLATALGLEPEQVLIGRQVHGVEIARRDARPEPNAFAEPGPWLSQADGQVTASPGLAPLVMVADCLPVALAGPGGVGMLHCGWRGLAAGIVERGADAVDAQAAAVGPGIGPCCYEVGSEVLDAFAPFGDGVAVGRTLDLREITRRLLERAGVARVEVSELCVSCSPELFFSHRRDGERTGRQAGTVWIDG